MTRCVKGVLMKPLRAVLFSAKNKTEIIFLEKENDKSIFNCFCDYIATVIPQELSSGTGILTFCGFKHFYFLRKRRTGH